MLKYNKNNSNTKKDAKSREGEKIIVRVQRRVSKEQGARSKKQGARSKEQGAVSEVLRTGIV